MQVALFVIPSTTLCPEHGSLSKLGDRSDLFPATRSQGVRPSTPRASRLWSDAEWRTIQVTSGRSSGISPPTLFLGAQRGAEKLLRASFHEAVGLWFIRRRPPVIVGLPPAPQSGPGRVFRKSCQESPPEGLGQFGGLPRVVGRIFGEFQDMIDSAAKVVQRSKHADSASFNFCATLAGPSKHPGHRRELPRQLMEARRIVPAPLVNFPGNFFGTPCREQSANFFWNRRCRGRQRCIPSSTSPHVRV